MILYIISMIKIALIEDDMAIVQMYRMKLESEGYTVVTAKDGRDGLELIKQESPDIVLLDYMMPVMTGAEMLEELRKQSYGKDLPVIVLTNTGKSEAPESILSNDVKKFIVKAEMTPADVVAEVKSVLKEAN